jgi:outer membrane protein TolC
MDKRSFIKVPIILILAQDTLKVDISTALEIALSENPTIKIANKEIERVDYSRKEAISGFFPTISAGGHYNRNIKKPVIFLPPGSPFGTVLEIGSDNSYAASLTASLPIYSATLFKSIQVSEVDIQLALESSRASKLNMISEVKNAFYTLLLANNSFEVMKVSVENAQKNLDNIRKLYQQGMVAEYDVIRSDVQVRNLKPTLVQAENGVRLSALMLKVLLGVDENIEILPIGNLTDYETDYLNFKPLAEVTLESNTNLRQLELQKTKLAKQYELLRTTRIPTLAAFGNYQIQSQANDFNFSDYEWVRTLSAGLQLQIPIFQGFAKRYKEQQVLVGIDQLKMQHDYLNRNLTLQMRNSVTNMMRAAEQISSSKVGIEQAERGYSIAQTRYNTGSGTILELNDAEVSLTQAKLNYNQALYDYLKAKVEFESIIGDDELIK